MIETREDCQITVAGAVIGRCKEGRTLQWVFQPLRITRSGAGALASIIAGWRNYCGVLNKQCRVSPVVIVAWKKADKPARLLTFGYQR